MTVIWHSINSDQILIEIFNNSSDIFKKFFLKLRFYQCFPVLWREDIMKVDLGIGVWHFFEFLFSDNKSRKLFRSYGTHFLFFCGKGTDVPF